MRDFLWRMNPYRRTAVFGWFLLLALLQFDPHRVKLLGLHEAVAALLGIVSCAIWLSGLPYRMIEMAFHPRWTALFVSPFVLTGIACFAGWRLAFWIFIALAFLAQGVITLLAPRAYA